MRNKILQWIAAGLMLETGLLHFISAQDEFEQAPFLGYLFIFIFLAALVAAYGLYRQKLWGWWLGSVLAIGSIVGFVMSRTVGLPGAVVEIWGLPAALLSLGVDCLFVFIVLLRPWRVDSTGQDVQQSPLVRKLTLASSIGMMLLVTSLALVWNVNAVGKDEGQVFSVQQLQKMDLLTLAELEQNYGMRVSQVGISMLDSVVDVRIKVIDPHKADQLLYGSTALWVDDKSLVLAPVRHSHNEMRPGQIFILFFPTQNGTVQVGSEVSLVFGDVRVESVTAR